MHDIFDLLSRRCVRLGEEDDGDPDCVSRLPLWKAVFVMTSRMRDRLSELAADYGRAHGWTS